MNNLDTAKLFLATKKLYSAKKKMYAAKNDALGKDDKIQRLNKKESREARIPGNTGDPRKAPQLIMFRTQDDTRVDEACAPFANRTFRKNSDARPFIPIHYGCRCFWESLETGEKLGQF